MQIYFHSCLCSYLPRVPILVEDTVSVVLLKRGFQVLYPSLRITKYVHDMLKLGLSVD